MLPDEPGWNHDPMTRPPEFWDGTVRRLAEAVPAHEIEAWLRPLHATRDGAEIRIVCPSALHRDRVRARYLDAIRAALGAELDSDEALHFRLDIGGAPPPMARVSIPDTGIGSGSASEPNGVALPALARRGEPAHTARSNGVPAERRVVAATGPPRRMRRAVQQSFDTFEVGPTNALAREAAYALASATQPEVNPLYLAGDSGQGKTHLARSIASVARSESARVIYKSAEGFTSEFLGALRSREVPTFKRRYRNDCDVLVLEDVDFLPGKENTQLELFHTVSDMLDAGARVVFTGARLPRAIHDLDRRLGGQMSCGLVAELLPPDAELRRRILRTRAAAGGIRLPESCLERLVEAVQGSVRDLESVLGQVVASATLLKRPVDAELTEAALRKLGAGVGPADAARPVAPREVIEMVAAFFGTTPEALASRSRRRDVLVPRQLAMYLCRRFTDASFSEIGRTMGRDHPSVRNAVRSMERQILERAPLRYQVEALSDRLQHLRTGK